MADPQQRDQYPRAPRLELGQGREVVYCHQCENEWYQHAHGLKCPRCDSEATEIVTTENDPRRPPTPEFPESFRQIHEHNPWAEDNDFPDPEEADVADYVTETPNGTRARIYTRTFLNPPRGPMNPNDPNNVIRDFQSMMGSFFGPGLQQGPPGRSGPDNLYPGAAAGPDVGPGAGPQGVWRQGRQIGNGPHVFGGTFTFTTGPRVVGAGGRPPAQAAADDLATYAPPTPSRSDSGHTYFIVSIRGSPDQLARVLAGLFGPMGVMADDNARGGPGAPPPFPAGIRGLLASLFNPENAVAGDAVYSQEALDRIISTLMEQHPTSNAPGPAAPEAIRNLPKKKLDEKMLGPDLKGECSVCMDDVKEGDEVVVLPCTHWFHEACATAWLSEHNTCPICRTGIGGEEPPQRPAQGRRRSSQAQVPGQPPPVDPNDPLRESARQRMSRRASRQNPPPPYGDRNESSSWMEPEYQDQRRRFHVVGDPSNYYNRSPSPQPNMPGSFRRRGSEGMSENQREARRGNTSGSDQSRQSSTSGNSGGGPMSWFRRFSGGGSGNGNSARREGS